MTDRPMIFSAPMIKALLGGRKTQTRRVLKKPWPYYPPQKHDDGSWWWSGKIGGTHLSQSIPLPYAAGDRLWVRETWHPVMEHHPVVLCKADNLIIYHDAGRSEPNLIYEQPSRWRSPIHMPRWASRITLIVTKVRVQRLHDMSLADAFAEGIPEPSEVRLPVTPSAKAMLTAEGLYPACDPFAVFTELWDSINAKRGFGWDADPWVVALTFTVHRQNIDQMQRVAAE